MGMATCKFAKLCRKYLQGLLGTDIKCKRDATSVVVDKSIIRSDGHKAATGILGKMCVAKSSALRML